MCDLTRLHVVMSIIEISVFVVDEFTACDFLSVSLILNHLRELFLYFLGFLDVLYLKISASFVC